MTTSSNYSSSNKKEQVALHKVKNYAKAWLDAANEEHEHYVGGLDWYRTTFIRRNLITALLKVGGNFFYNDHEFSYNEKTDELIVDGQSSIYDVEEEMLIINDIKYARTTVSKGYVVGRFYPFSSMAYDK